MTWLNHEHKDFESAIHRCWSVCDNRDWALVRKLFRNFRHAYEVHLRLEEDVVFPMYEKRAGVSTEPTDSLRSDHAQILNLCKHIQRLLGRGEYQRVRDELSLLYRSLLRHHEKEEEIFLPMASEVLLADKEKLLARLNSA